LGHSDELVHFNFGAYLVVVSLPWTDGWHEITFDVNVFVAVERNCVSCEVMVAQEPGQFC
jgi:hypothetical protein